MGTADRDYRVRVNWRAVLSILAGVLLPLPLVLVMSGVLRPELPEVDPGGRRISPVLTPEECERLMTYRRDCGEVQPCEPPLGCVTETRARRQYCTDSQCSEDVSCRKPPFLPRSHQRGPWHRTRLPQLQARKMSRVSKTLGSHLRARRPVRLVVRPWRRFAGPFLAGLQGRWRSSKPAGRPAGPPKERASCFAMRISVLPLNPTAEVICA